MPQPQNNETHEDFIKRCMSYQESKQSFPDDAQRYAVCESKWHESTFSGLKISFDYDSTLSTAKGTELAKKLIQSNDVYIISARSNKDNMLTRAKEIGIPESRIYAMGSNNDKIKQIKRLGINTHYDNNPKVVDALGSVGKLFK